NSNLDEISPAHATIPCEVKDDASIRSLSDQGGYVRFGSKADMCGATRHVRFTPNSDRKSGLPHKVMSALPPKADMCIALAHVCLWPIADIQDARFEALKMYLLLLKKYLPATFKRSNSLCHSLRSLAETSSLPPTWFRTNCASPLL